MILVFEWATQVPCRTNTQLRHTLTSFILLFPDPHCGRGHAELFRELAHHVLNAPAPPQYGNHDTQGVSGTPVLGELWAHRRGDLCGPRSEDLAECVALGLRE